MRFRTWIENNERKVEITDDTGNSLAANVFEADINVEVTRRPTITLKAYLTECDVEGSGKVIIVCPACKREIEDQVCASVGMVKKSDMS